MFKNIIFILIGILLFIVLNNLDGFSYCQNPFRDTMGNNSNNVRLLNKGTYPILLKDNNVLKWTNSRRETEIINTKDQNGFPSLSELQVQCNPGDDTNAKWNVKRSDTNYNTSFTCKSPSYKACIRVHGHLQRDYIQIIPYNMQIFSYLNDGECYTHLRTTTIDYTLVIINKIFKGNFNTYYNKYDFDNIARLVLDDRDLQNYFNRNDLFTDITDDDDDPISYLEKPIPLNFGKVFSENENLNGNLMYTDDFHTSAILNTNLFNNLEDMENIIFENHSENIFNLYIPKDKDTYEYQQDILNEIRLNFIPFKFGPYCIDISGLFFNKNPHYEIFYDLTNPYFVNIQHRFNLIDLDLLTETAYSINNKYQVTFNYEDDPGYSIDNLKQKCNDVIDFYIRDMSVDIRLLDLICPVPTDGGYSFSSFFNNDYRNGFVKLKRLYPNVPGYFENIRTFSGENIMEIPDITNTCQVPLFCLNAYQPVFTNLDGKLNGGEFTGIDVKDILFEILLQIENYATTEDADDLDLNYGFGYIYNSNLSKIGINLGTYNAQYYSNEGVLGRLKDRLNRLYRSPINVNRDNLINFNLFNMYNLWNRWGFPNISNDLSHIFVIQIDSAVFFILIQLFKQTNGEYYDLHNFTCLEGIDPNINNKRNFTKPYHWQFKYPEIPPYNDDSGGVYKNRLDYKFGSECELDKCENNTELDERLSNSPFKRVEDNPSSPYHHAIYRYSNKNGLENVRKPKHNIINYNRDSSPNFNIDINKTDKNSDSLVIECKTPPNRYVKINCKQGKDPNGKFDGRSTYNHDISIAEDYAERICNGRGQPVGTARLPGYFENINDNEYEDVGYETLLLNVRGYMDLQTPRVCGARARILSV